MKLTNVTKKEYDNAIKTARRYMYQNGNENVSRVKMIKLTVDLTADGPETFKDALGNLFDFLIDHVEGGIIKGSFKTQGAHSKFSINHLETDAVKILRDRYPVHSCCGISDPDTEAFELSLGVATEDLELDLLKIEDAYVRAHIKPIDMLLDGPGKRSISPRVCEFCIHLQTNGNCYESPEYGISGWGPMSNNTCPNWKDKQPDEKLGCTGKDHFVPLCGVGNPRKEGIFTDITEPESKYPPTPD